MRNSDSFMTSSRQSVKSSHTYAAGGTSSLSGGGSSFIQPGGIPTPVQWPNGATACMPGAHAPNGVYYNAAATQLQPLGQAHAACGVPAGVLMPQGYGAPMPANGQMPETSYFPNLGVFLPGRRRSRSRTPPRGRGSGRPQSRAPGAAHVSPRSSQRKSQSRDQLMESLTAFQKVTKATTASFSKSRSAATSSADGADDRVKRIAGGALMADVQSAANLQNECSVGDVPMQPRGHSMAAEGSDSSVVRNGSVSFALAGASYKSNSNSNALAAKLKEGPPGVDAESSFATCCTHATFATGIGAIAEERSRDIAGGASSFFKDCSEPPEAMLSMSSPSRLQLSGEQGDAESVLSPVMSPVVTIARSARSGREVATSDVEDDASVLSVMVSQSDMRVCKSPEGTRRFSLQSPQSSHGGSMSPEKVDTFTEAAPSVALLQVRCVLRHFTSSLQ